MGQIALIVVAAAWAAVLLPPLLRSRAENRPNSSVSDFRDQLFSLQRAMPTRGVTVRTMGRPLAPSSLGRPAAPGRPTQRGGRPAPQGVRGQNSYGPSRQGGRNESQRMQEASLRTRTHGERDGRDGRDPSGSARRPVAAARPVSDVKRRRANVLFGLVIATACGGFLAATTGSDAMVLLFAAGMIALGGYVYLLVTMNQRESGVSPVVAARQARAERYQAVSRRVQAPADPLVRDWTPADGYSYGDLDDGSYDDFYDEPQHAARRSPRSDSGYGYRPAPVRAVPGSGQSGRISYGRPAAPRRVAHDPYAAPTPRDPRDPFGREQQGREITRGTQIRNGRHATGQHPVQQQQRRPQGAARRA